MRELSWLGRDAHGQAGFTDELLSSPVDSGRSPEMALVLDAETAESTLDWSNAGCLFPCPSATARTGSRPALGLFPCGDPQCNEGAARRADAGGNLRSGLGEASRVLRGVVAAGDQRGGLWFGWLGVAQRNVVLFRQ
jgi:hypothetical protein